MKNKFLSKILGAFEYIAKHNKLSFISLWLCVYSIFMLSNVEFYQWEYWVIFILLIFFMVLNYAKGRIDEEIMNENILEELKSEIKKQLYSALTDYFVGQNKPIPQIKITEKENN